MPSYAKGTYVFVPDDDECYVPAKVSSTFESGKPGAVSLVSTKRNMKLSAGETKNLVVMDEQSLKSNEDMVQMKRLDTASILHNLRLRYAKNLIYTNIGSILVAVNPFQQLPIYGPSVIDDYMKNGSRGKAPHIYGVADNAYKALTGFYKNQACIVSGESGAGKTETTKLFLQYVAEKSGSGGQGDGTPIQEQILEANPIMEAFGNAKTVRNDNSSRFGKWIEVSFNNKNGHIVGGNITQYLLEKSRVVQQAESERNYHIFYQLCLAGQINPKIKKKYNVLEADEYYYLNQSKESATKVESIDDKADWEATLQAMNVLGIAKSDQEDVITTVSGILHLGNISFEGGDKSKVSKKEALEGTAKLMGVDSKGLEEALTRRSLKMGGETIFADNNKAQAGDARDALAKSVYSMMFDWLISKINESLKKSKIKTGGKDTSSIGVLDIFGFESFKHNSFEQLCINFCNEKLQGHFNEHIFKLEQKEYKAEGIDVSKIEFVDNADVIEALATKGTGIFAMIDEEINLPKGDDEGFLKKVIAKADGKVIKKPDMKKLRGDSSARSQFVIDHYAGEVSYDATGFLEKNKDRLLDDLAALGGKSKNKYIKKLFETQAAKDSGGKGASKKKTLGFQFKEQLNDLMKTLNACEPHFVRCVKPNAEKKGGLFTAPMCLDQLNYAGLLEVCRIRQLGYPVRKDFKEFLTRFKPLHPKSKDVKDLCKALEKEKFLKKNEYQLGKSKVFVRTEQFNDLEAAREKGLGRVAILIQATVRGFVQRSKYKRYKKILKEIDGAVKSRDETRLEKALLGAGQLPHNGHGKGMKGVAAGRKMLAKLQEERRLLTLLKDATKANDESAIKSAIDACKAAKIKDKAVEKAEKLLKTLIAQAAIKKELNQLIKGKDLKALKAAIKKADDAKVSDKDMPALKEARVLADRLDKVEKTVKELEAANKKKDSKAIEKLMTKMVELGAKDHPSVAEGEKITKKAAEASESRNKEVKKLEKELEKAVESADFAQLVRLEEKAIEFGLESDIVKKAQKLREKLEASQDTASKLSAVQRALDITSRGHDGIKKADIKPLADAIKEAKKDGAQEDDEELVAAVDFKKKMEKQLKVQEQLAEALKSNKPEDLKKSLLAATGLGLETGNAKAVADLVRDNEKSDMSPEEREKERLKIAEKLKEGTAEQLADQALERLTKLSSSAHAKRIQQASDNSRYDLAKYYKIRTDEDYTEYDPPSFKKQRATLKLWSRTKPIPKSLLELDNDLNKIAIRLNRAVLQYCGDLSTSFPATLAHYILVTGLETPTLCDEIYIQLCKHVRGNTRKESADRGWLLMCMCTKTFPPSPEFSPYLLNYLVNRRAAPGLIGNYARLSLLQLDATLELGPTWFKPNIDEIKCYRKRPPILATIERVDGHKEDFPVTPDLRVAQVLEMCRRSAKIKDNTERPTWGIFVKDNEQNLELEPKERLIRFYKKYNAPKLVHVDLFLESWKGNEVELFEKLVEKYGPEPTSRDEALLEASKKKSSNVLSMPILAARSAAKRMGLATEARPPPPSPQSPWPLPWWVHLGDVYLRMSNQNKDPTFVFKRRLITPATEEDDWLHKQLSDDLSNGELIVKSDAVAHEMAALSVAIRNKGKLDAKAITGLLPLVVPPTMLEKAKPKDLAKVIKGQKIPASVDAQIKKYISLAKKSHVYGMCFFAVCRQDSDKEYVCGVDCRGVHILNPKRAEVIRTFKFSTIKKFGSTSEFLWMNVIEGAGDAKTGSGFPLVKNSQGMNVVLYTLQSWEIYDMLYDYTHM